MDGQSIEPWHDLWRRGYTPWLRKEPNPWLWKHLHRLVNETPSDGIFLVPCCSKNLDMRTLYEKGFKVVGVEIYEEAVKQFFQEQQLQATTREVPGVEGGCTEYSTQDGGLRILVMDFFKLTPEIIGGPVKMVWDRGSMGSIEKAKRKDYVKTMLNLLHPEVRYLLDVFHYNDWYTDNTPPRNFPFELMQEILGDRFDIEFLEREQQSVRVINSNGPIYRNLYFMKFKKV